MRTRRLFLALIVALAVVGGLSSAGIAPARAAGALTLGLRPPAGPNGVTITLVGGGAGPYSQVNLIYGGFGGYDDCLNTTTAGQGIPGGQTTADAEGKFTFTHKAAQGPTVGAIRFLASGTDGRTSPWTCYRITADAQTFPLTGKTARGAFYRYWLENGDLAQQGYPLSDEFTEVNPSNGQQYTVQYFQRARFELHTQAGAPDRVLLGLLGNEQYGPKYPAPPPPLVGDPFPGYLGSRACETFAKTGYEVCGAFLAYWLAHGDLAQQGYPIGPVFMETNPTNGQQYPTQYFERARFEYHAELAGTENAVLLGLLGDEQYTAKDGGGQPAPSGSPSPAPGSPVLFRDDFTNPQSGWPTARAPGGEGEYGYANGGYRIGIAAANYGLLPTNSRVGNLGDVRIEVDGVKVAGPDNTPFGLQCRVRNTDNLYAAIYDGEGYAAILKVEGGKRTFLANSGGGPSPAFRAGNATNRLRFECVGNTLTFFANGQKVLEAQDATFTTGRIGFAGFTGKAGGLDIVFRALVVYGPDGARPAVAPLVAERPLLFAPARVVEGWWGVQRERRFGGDGGR